MRNLGIVIGCFLLASWFPAMADGMECGTHLITDDEESGQTMSEIKEQCGAPDSVTGDDWYYKKEDGATYQLHFDASGELDSITQH